MEEKIEQIAEAIVAHRKNEIITETTNTSVGRIKTLFNNEETQFWLINKAADLVTPTDFNGNIITTAIYTTNKPYSGDGKNVSKNSKLGGLFIQNHEGVHTLVAPAGSITIEIFNRATYSVPKKDENTYATDILIKIAGDGKIHSFRDIAKILSIQADIDSEKERLAHATEQEAKDLIQSIEEKEKEKKTYLDKAESFIRRYAEIRYQPILDPVQDKIKSSKIFNGPLIINGGPGTGKTTSLIQRIKFLISPTIEEYVTLTGTQKSVLFNQNTSWIFYSPNELLALFLRNSMKMEELIADSNRVKVWSLHKNELVKSYKLVDTTTKRPFLIYNRLQGKNLLLNNPTNIQLVFNNLVEFYFSFQKEKINRVLEIDLTPFKWKNTGISIQRYLTDRKTITSNDELIRLFLNLNETYGVESNKISDEYASQVKQVAGRIQVLVLKDPQRASTLLETLSKWKISDTDEEEEEDDDTEIEQEDFDEKEEPVSFDFDKDLFTKLKSICRKQSLKQFDRNTKLSTRDKAILALIPEAEHQPEFDQIGQTAFFKKFFERLTKGIVANILREIPMIYKKFRRKELTEKKVGFDLSILEDLVKKDKNSRIHADEQALLLYFVNSLSTRLAKGFPQQYESLNHSYINAFKANCKPVMGVDEATDFSIIDLLAINSFRHPEFSSLTLSGDIMQRITAEGLNSWDDFSSIVPDTEKNDLSISYRQSPTLLALAKDIYEKSTGKPANYTSYIEKDEAEPKPLMIISTDENLKLNWIAKRIIEIHSAYGETIPSIAIFLPEENQLEEFAKKLGSIDTLADVGINVKACRNGEVLGDKDTVRIFAIDKIKGLEFEAVFFHNLDNLRNQDISAELLLKYLYVGLSRATFYLGLTVNESFGDDVKFMTSHFDVTGETWKK